MISSLGFSFDSRYAEPAIESAAATPMIRPVAPTDFVFENASAMPLSVPVSSTKASFIPSTMPPAFTSFVSFNMEIRLFSWFISSS